MLFLRFSCFKELAFFKERLLQQCWEMELRGSCPPHLEMGRWRAGWAEKLAVFDAIYWEGGSTTWDLLLETKKNTAFSDGQLDAARGTQARKGCPAKAMLRRTHGCSGTSNRAAEALRNVVCWSHEPSDVQKNQAGRQSPRNEHCHGKGGKGRGNPWLSGSIHRR